jgi:WhiB family redox-sensing transcriptional regulator
MTYVSEFPDLSEGPCRGMDARLFYPLKGGRGANTTGNMAKAVCDSGSVGGRPCPCRDACLQWALHHEMFGVWGGTSERQRRRIRHERNIIVDTVLGGAPQFGARRETA